MTVEPSRAVALTTTTSQLFQPAVHLLFVSCDVVEEDFLQERSTLLLCTGLSVHDHGEDTIQPETGGREKGRRMNKMTNKGRKYVE